VVAVRVVYIQDLDPDLEPLIPAVVAVVLVAAKVPAMVDLA
jgi:hypothetical protein